MAEIYTFIRNGYVAVGKRQLLHHAYLYFPPSEDSSEAKKQYASDINRIIVAHRIIVEDGKHKRVEIPMLYGNWELTAADINITNRWLSDPENTRENRHRYLNPAEYVHNSGFAQYDTERGRVTWDIFFSEYFKKTRVYSKSKDALRQALLSRESLLRLSHNKRVEEREKAIRERDRIIAKGISEWRSSNGRTTNNVTGIILSPQERFRLYEVKGTIKLLTDTILS